MKLRLRYCVLLTLFLSCTVNKNPEVTGTSQGPNIFGNSTATGNFNFSGSQCPNKSIDALSPVVIKRFNNASGGSEDIRFIPSTLNNTNSLESVGIQSTLYAYEEQKTCYGTDKNCVSTKILREPKNLNICNDIDSYARDSNESIAVNAAVNIDTAYAFYDSVRGSRPQLPRAQLLVHPVKTLNVYKSRSDQILVESKKVENNLALSPSFYGLPTFIIYRKSEKAIQKNFWNGAFLTDSLWALGHETGHLIFRQNAFKGLNYPQRLAHTEIGAYLPESIITGEPSLIDFNGLPRTVSFYDTVSTVNEAFADLYGLYVNSSNASGIDRINCFEKRDPTLDRYSSSGSFKVLSSDILDVFYSRLTSGEYNCTEPWFQDIHDFGQPIAHGIHSIFVSAVGNNSVSLADRLLTWATNINDLVSNNAEVELDALVYQGVKASEINSRLSATQCQTIKRVFPAFEQKWTNEGKLNCQ